jgi:membrane protein implicated in regulation of membrane protease activity
MPRRLLALLKPRRKLNWFYVAALIVNCIGLWHRRGPIWVAIALALGVLLTVFVVWRARRRGRKDDSTHRNGADAP